MKRSWLGLMLAAGLVSLSHADQSTGTVPSAPQTSTPAPAAPASAPAAAPAQTPAASVTVDKLSVGTGVENHEITGEAAEFPAGTDKVYCLSRVTAANAPAAIKHVWYKDGVKTAEVPLTIKFSPFTTYSYHFMPPGQWKVEVQDESGAVVSSAQFTVK